jgi:transcriptional regulator with XRE-family HTH domain
MKLYTQKIKNEMNRQGISYIDLANKLGKASRQYGWWLVNNNNSHTLSTINKLAKVLQLDPKDLLI